MPDGAERAARLIAAAWLALATASLALGPAGLARAEDPADLGPPRLRVTGYLENDTAYRVRTPRSFQKSQSRVELEVEARLTDDFRLRSAGWVLWDPVAKLTGRDHDFPEKPWNRWQIQDSRRISAELRELTLDWNGHVGAARVDLRLGLQQVVWGQSLGLRILDVVNAQDYREFLLEDFNDARTPIFGANAEVWLAGWTVQGLLFPTFEPNQLPDTTSEFALNPELDGFLPRFASFTAPPSVPAPFTLVDLNREERPNDWTGRSLAFGARAARTVRGVDLGLTYWDAVDPAQAWDRRITYLPAPGLGLLPVNQLTPKHVRVRTLGASFSTALGSFTLWGEGTLAFGKSFSVNDLSDRDGQVERPELSTVVGLDWTGLDPLFANVQWIQAVVIDHEHRIGIDPVRTYLSLLLRLPLRSETWIPQLFAIYGMNHSDAMLRPSVVWKATDRLSVTAGVDWFLGASKGLFGQYAHRRECTPVPAVLPVQDAGQCVPDVRPGRTSRVYVAVRWAFDVSH